MIFFNSWLKGQIATPVHLVQASFLILGCRDSTLFFCFQLVFFTLELYLLSIWDIEWLNILSVYFSAVCNDTGMCITDFQVSIFDARLKGQNAVLLIQHLFFILALYLFDMGYRMT